PRFPGLLAGLLWIHLSGDYHCLFRSPRIRSARTPRAAGLAREHFEQNPIGRSKQAKGGSMKLAPQAQRRNFTLSQLLIFEKKAALPGVLHEHKVDSWERLRIGRLAGRVDSPAGKSPLPHR